LRYFDANLNKEDCNAFASDHTAKSVHQCHAINPSGLGSNWCGAMAKISVDLISANIK
jgi:hypothetical protein